jgi:nuclear RNA export factor
LRNNGSAHPILVAVHSAADAVALEKASGLRFAGHTLSMRQVDGEGGSSNGAAKSVAADKTIDTLKQFLSTRYASESKMLDLSRMHEDPLLLGIGLVANTSASSKMFPALMKLLSQEKMDVLSVNLEGNKLKDVSGVSTLAQTFPKLKNLSLANNEIRRYNNLDAWAGKNKLASLQELILTGNPLREDEMAKNRAVEYRSEVTKRFPGLKMLDMEPIAAGISFDVDSPDEPSKASSSRTPLPVSVIPSFYESDSVQAAAMDFLGKFFPAFDQDRAQLEPVYAENAVFSMSSNLLAPKKKSTGAFASGSNWSPWLGTSRNLVRITQLDARITRTFVGRQQIIGALKALPTSTHDLSDAGLFSVDCWSFPTSEGHMHIQICVHGEFKEKISAKQTTRRSFDRTFVLAPGPNGGVLIKSDLFLVRNWGGSDAWRGDVKPASVPEGSAAAQTAAVPNGGGAPADGRPPGVDDKQFAMLNALRQQTGLNMQYAGLCLQQYNWDLAAAVEVTQGLKASGSLPADAFT